MNVYQSIEWVREERGNFSINRNTARYFGSREMNKNLSYYGTNLVNSKWLPLGSKSINLSIYANKKLQTLAKPPFFPANVDTRSLDHLPKLLIIRI